MQRSDSAQEKEYSSPAAANIMSALQIIRNAVNLEE